MNTTISVANSLNLKTFLFCTAMAAKGKYKLFHNLTGLELDVNH